MRALLDGDRKAADAADRRVLATFALAAAADGSIAVEGTRQMALRALPVEPPEWSTFLAAGTALCYCDAFAELDIAVAAAGDLVGAGADLPGQPRRTAGFGALLGLTDLRRGRLRGAQSQLALALAGGHDAAPDLAAALSECALELGEPDPYPEANGHADVASTLGATLTRGRRLLGLGQVNPACSAWRSEAAALCLRLGDNAAALRLASAELELARRFGAPRAIGIALRALGMAVPGESAGAHLTASVAALSGSGAELELARSQVELGAHLRRSGERREGRDSLRAGLDLAERLGAVRLAERADVELRATGARPRRAVLSGVASLTASEQRVAELAAAGLTTRAIAQELFVTMRTVTTHLTHIYRKLEIAGRDEIAPLLALREPGTSHRRPASPLATVAGPSLDASAARGPAVTELLDRLTARSRALAEALAILAEIETATIDHFTLARQLADLDPAEAEQAREDLARSDLLETGGEPAVMPRSLSRGVYETLAAGQRSDGHAAAARLLRTQPRGIRTAAAHLARTPPAGDPEAVSIFRAAAAEALSGGVPQEACELLRRALAEPPAGDQLAIVTGELGAAEAVVRHPAAESHLMAASGDLTADTLRSLVQLVGGRLSEAHSLALATAASLGADVAPELLAPIEATRACVALLDRRYADELEPRIGVIRALSVAAGVTGRPIQLVDAFWKWTATGAVDATVRQIDRSLSGDGWLQAPALLDDLVGALALMALVSVDDRSRAERTIAAVFEQAMRRGSVAAAVLALGWSSHLALRTGSIGAALRDAAAARELATDLDVGAITPLLAAFHGEALLERGDPVAALVALDSVSLGGLEGSVPAAYLSFARGRVHLATGRRLEAIAELRRCRAASAGLVVDNPNVLPSRSWLARAIGSEAPDEARSLVQEELALARRLRQPRAIGVALHGSALVDRDPEQFTAAVATLSRAPAPLLRAGALSDLGESLLSHGRADEALEALNEALTVALRSGATRLANALAERLSAKYS